MDYYYRKKSGQHGGVLEGKSPPTVYQCHIVIYLPNILRPISIEGHIKSFSLKIKSESLIRCLSNTTLSVQRRLTETMKLNQPERQKLGSILDSKRSMQS